MHRTPSALLSPAARRPGWLHALAFLCLAALLGAWGQAQAMMLPGASDELVHASTFIEADGMAASMATLDDAAVCIKPRSSPSSGVDLVCNEILDQEALSLQPVWVLPPHFVRQSAVQPVLQQAERQPLLRPPIRLG